MRVLILFATFAGTFRILEIIQGDTVINIRRSSCKVLAIPVRF